MATDESISNDGDDQRKGAKAGSGPAANVNPAKQGDESPMAKPSALWFLVPIVLIALGVFLAR